MCHSIGVKSGGITRNRTVLLCSRCGALEGRMGLQNASSPRTHIQLQTMAGSINL